jgi:hypothetical protein
MHELKREIEERREDKWEREKGVERINERGERLRETESEKNVVCMSWRER